MSNNLTEILNYINNTIVYGSTIERCFIGDLFEKYPISNEEKCVVDEELESLHIQILEEKVNIAQEYYKMISMLSRDNEISQSELNQWFLSINATEDEIKYIKDKLSSDSYSIINDIDIIIDFEQLEFLNELDLRSLDSLLDDEDFISEVECLKSVPTISANNDYIERYQSSSNSTLVREEAINDLVIANSKLVWKIVSSYKSYETVSFDEYDMYQCGVIGLMKAAEKFDTNLGFKFSTYATSWIKQSISRNIIDFSTLIRVPVHMHEEIIKLQKVSNEYYRNHEQIPDIDTLSTIMSIPREKVSLILRSRGLANVTSLNTPIGESQEDCLIDLLQDHSIKTPEELMLSKSLKSELNEVLNDRLTNKEKAIICMRFGLNEGEPKTLEEIGRIYDVTRERIRQIESKAIKKLQKLPGKERLRGYLDDFN